MEILDLNFAGCGTGRSLSSVTTTKVRIFLRTTTCVFDSGTAETIVFVFRLMQFGRAAGLARRLVARSPVVRQIIECAPVSNLSVLVRKRDPSVWWVNSSFHEVPISYKNCSGCTLNRCRTHAGLETRRKSSKKSPSISLP